MQRSSTRIGLLAALLFASGAALAHGDVKCVEYPKAEWKDHNELYRKLQSEGWEIRRMEQTKTCYEVYGKDPAGKRVEAFFDPKTFERVEPK
jgi:hypothetical protein